MADAMDMAGSSPDLPDMTLEEASPPTPGEAGGEADGGEERIIHRGEHVAAAEAQRPAAAAAPSSMEINPHPPHPTASRPVSSSPEEGPATTALGDAKITAGGSGQMKITVENAGAQVAEDAATREPEPERRSKEGQAMERILLGAGAILGVSRSGAPTPPPLAAAAAATQGAAPDNAPGGPTTTSGTHSGGAAGGGIHLTLAAPGKKRKRKPRPVGGMASFGDNDDEEEEEARRRLPALELADMADIPSGGDGLLGGAGPQTEPADDGGSTLGDAAGGGAEAPREGIGAPAGAIHHRAVPPARAMSPMPQREGAGTPPVLPSPNAPSDEAGQHLGQSVGQHAQNQQQQQQQQQRQGMARQHQLQQHSQQQHAQQQLQHRFRGASDTNGGPRRQPHPQQQLNHPSQQPNQPPTPQQQLNNQPPQHQPSAPPPGWRVKLYRLVPDGTWKDCGTGRVRFYFHRPMGEPAAATSSSSAADRMGKADKGEEGEATKTSLFQAVGEPMLCVRAERGDDDTNAGGEGGAGNNNAAPNNINNNRVILRARVLLHDAYRCQGGNIITWCEPFRLHGNAGQQQQGQQQQGGQQQEAGRQQQQQQQHEEGKAAEELPPHGVDLALSFQDNAGCREIWQRITEAQSRAREASRRGAGGGDGRGDDASTASVEGSTDGKTGGAGLSIARPAEGPLHHHAGRPRSPRTPPKGSPPQHAHHHHHHHHGLLSSPNSPDHDAVEDRQLGWGAGAATSGTMGTAGSGGGGPLGIPPRPPLPSAPAEGGAEHRLHVHDHAARPNSPKTAHLDTMAAQASAAGSENERMASARDGEDDDGDDLGPMPRSAMNDGDGPNGAAPAPPPGCPPLPPQRGFSPLQFRPAADPSSLLASHLPARPTWDDLPSISELISAWSPPFQPQREELLAFLARDECSYVRQLLGLFARARPPGADADELSAELAAAVKAILLLNDPEIVECATSDPLVFEEICAILEYDPDLRQKADYVSFLSRGARFRTVVWMDDAELVGNVHRLFRVNYLKDVCLRPTMDEGSLSTLASLGQFTMSDIVRGAVAVPRRASGESGNGENYLVRIVRLLGTEVRAIRRMQREEGGDGTGRSPGRPTSPSVGPFDSKEAAPATDDPHGASSIEWRQHLVPQDASLPSRLLRRRGCLLFLRELFDMVRTALQPHEKDDFLESVVALAVPLAEGGGGSADAMAGEEGDAPLSAGDHPHKRSFAEMSPPAEERPPPLADAPSRTSPTGVHLLSLLGGILCDPTTDAKERGAALDVLGTIAMHEPCLIRRSCLDRAAAGGNAATDERALPPRPEPNDRREVLFPRPADDVLLSLIVALGTETDAGLLLQASEIIRIVLDTEVAGEGPGPPSPMGGGGGVLDEENDINAANGPNGGGNGDGLIEGAASSSGASESDQTAFLALFYDRYVPWLAAPFQYGIVVPRTIPPDEDQTERAAEAFRSRGGDESSSPLLAAVPPCPVRRSFALEVLGFCVRAHVHRMKFFVLRTRLLGAALKILGQEDASLSGLRCLKLAVLKLLRSVLSVKDEFYHRHIVQYNLFAPVFDLFRSIPSVGGNLISSAILDLCDCVCADNIKSLIEYIVHKHLSKRPSPAATADATDSSNNVNNATLEEFANPHVDTFKQLRKAYEENNAESSGDGNALNGGRGGLLLMNGGISILNKKAQEDQRKFREADEEESYFNEDDDSGGLVGPAPLENKLEELADVSSLMEDVNSLDGGREGTTHAEEGGSSEAAAPARYSFDPT